MFDPLRRSVPWLAAVLLFSTQPLAAQTDRLALSGLDPVALCRGQEVPGREDLTANWFRYVYRFADGDSLAAFRADPERWCIQFGGGCGRMGPLSGRGDPDRWWVYEGRIYIFASEQCRKAFQQAPERFVPQPLPKAPADADAARKGRDAITRAAAALGSGETLAAFASVRFERSWTTADRDGDRNDAVQDTVALPDRVRRDQRWGDYVFASVAAPHGDDAGFFVGDDGIVFAMHPAGAAELRAEALRHPIVLLQRRDDPGFSAVAIGTDTVQGRAVDLVRVRCGAVDTTLAIARDDGAVLQQRLRARTPRLAFGDLVETYGDVRAVAGLRVPFRVEQSFDGGEPVAFTWDAIEPGGKVDDALFTAPHGGR
ncbi:MAG: hypothetical protein AB7O97_00240 [Planctomycetota bacterium]